MRTLVGLRCWCQPPGIIIASPPAPCCDPNTTTTSKRISIAGVAGALLFYRGTTCGDERQYVADDILASTTESSGRVRK